MAGTESHRSILDHRHRPGADRVKHAKIEIDDPIRFETMNMKINDKNILVVGLGKTGVATAIFLKDRGANVTVTDNASRENLAPQAEVMEANGVRMELGGHVDETFTAADLIVLSPGVSHTADPVQAARRRGIPIIGEVELATGFIDEPIIAVTGTNGKTTTTELIGEMLKRSGFNVFVGGNIGNPLINYAGASEKADIVVAEISSFQLDTADTFKPRVGVLLNITEDHLDRYDGFNEYARSKARIFKNQDNNDTAVFNGSDPLIVSLCKDVKSHKQPFYHAADHHDLPFKGALINSGKIIIHPEHGAEQIVDLSGTRLAGRHNVENISAACLAAVAVGAGIEGIGMALKAFKGLAHRIEYVTSVKGIRFFNDSKATNVDAVVRALESFEQPVILIMGGRNKGNDFKLMADAVRRHAKTIVVLGEAKEEIASLLKECAPIIMVDTMRDAVSRAYQKAAPNDIVLLSPACASFDMYESYAQRGDDFCHAVNRLKEDRSAL
jgi:UDP-N-acetylmuramoylalanine--D-glutamate ligase